VVAQDLASGATRVVAESSRGDVADVLLNPRTVQAEAYAVNYLKNEWTPTSSRLMRR